MKVKDNTCNKCIWSKSVGADKYVCPFERCIKYFGWKVDK